MFAHCQRCERLAAGLTAEGIRPGDRVAYLSFNNNALLEGYYGVVLESRDLWPSLEDLMRANQPC